MPCVTYGELQGFRAKDVNNFDIVCKEKEGTVLNNIENIFNAQQEKQGPRTPPGAILLDTNLGSDLKPFI